MAHPQTNFSSNFQGSDGMDSALDITVNGESTEYRPSGGDQSIELTEPVIFEMNDNPTYAEINPVIGLHVPVYLHVSGTGIDYMVPYVGQESSGEGLRFAIPDSQNKCIKYWICRNGASWVSGENPLDVAFTGNTPTFAQIVAAADTKRLVAWRTNSDKTYILTAIEEHYVVFSTVSDSTVTSIIITDDGNPSQTKTYDFNNYEPKIGFVNGHFAVSPNTQYLKICEANEIMLDSYDGQTSFAITIPSSADSNDDCEGGVFEVGYSATGSPTTVTVTSKWLYYKKGAGLIDRIAVTVSSDKKKLEVWLKATKINYKNVYVRALTNRANLVLSDLYQGTDYKFIYPNSNPSMSGTGWDTTGTVYEYAPIATNHTVVIPLSDFTDNVAGLETKMSYSYNSGDCVMIDDGANRIRYVITSRTTYGGYPTYYGLAASDTIQDFGADINTIKLVYTGTWAVTVANRIVRNLITDAIFIIDGDKVAAAPADVRLQFNQVLLAKCAEFCEIVWIQTNHGKKERYTLGRYLQAGDITDYEFARVYRDSSLNIMETLNVSYDETTNVFTITTDAVNF